MGLIGYTSGLYRDNGKEIGNYYIESCLWVRSCWRPAELKSLPACNVLMQTIGILSSKVCSIAVGR